MDLWSSRGSVCSWCGGSRSLHTQTHTYIYLFVYLCIYIYIEPGLYPRSWHAYHFRPFPRGWEPLSSPSGMVCTCRPPTYSSLRCGNSCLRIIPSVDFWRPSRLLHHLLQMGLSENNMGIHWLIIPYIIWWPKLVAYWHTQFSDIPSTQMIFVCFRSFLTGWPTRNGHRTGNFVFFLNGYWMFVGFRFFRQGTKPFPSTTTPSSISLLPGRWVPGPSLLWKPSNSCFFRGYLRLPDGI